MIHSKDFKEEVIDKDFFGNGYEVRINVSVFLKKDINTSFFDVIFTHKDFDHCKKMER